MHVFILSAHFQSLYWLKTQRLFLDEFVDLPHTRILGLNGIAPTELAAGENYLEYSGGHSEALDVLASRALQSAGSSDFLLFLDSDAFPIAPISRLLPDLEAPLAIQRLENAGDVQPHPSFAVFRADTYRKLRPTWSSGMTWTDILGRERTDVGAGILEALNREEIPWRPMHRVNQLEAHPLFFGVYGDSAHGALAYHHGAGSRTAEGRVTKILRRKFPLLFHWMRLRFTWERAVVASRLFKGVTFSQTWLRLCRQEEFERELRTLLSQDLNFHRAFVGGKKVSRSWLIDIQARMQPELRNNWEN